MKPHYKDPLEAAWMRDKYGMRFTDQSGKELSWDKEYCCYYLPDGSSDEQAWDGKHYVHADSLPLLEPQFGDVVNVEGNGRNPYSESRKGLYIGHIQYNSIGVVHDYQQIKIIQRNGISFMWPEFEA